MQIFENFLRITRSMGVILIILIYFLCGIRPIIYTYVYCIFIGIVVSVTLPTDIFDCVVIARI